MKKSTSNIKKSILISVLVVAMFSAALIITACSSPSNTGTGNTNIPSTPPDNTNVPTTPTDNGANAPQANTSNIPTNPEAGRTKLSDSRDANNAYLISGDTLDAATQRAISGFSIQKTPNADGTTTISLTSSNPEYQNQSYTLQSGEQLYFIERSLGDDSNNEEGALGDDSAIIVDAQGYIVQ